MRRAPQGYDVVVPNRRLFAAEYERLAGQSGMRIEIEGELVGDLLVGALLNRMLATGQPPSSAAARAAVDVILNGIRQREPVPQSG